MHVIILGAPGAGKGTQSAEIVKKYQLQHLSTGDMLRAEIAEGTPLGTVAKGIIEKGELVSDEIILGMVEAQIKNNENGMLFDGFPRTTVQAEGLDKLLASLNSQIDHAILLEVDNEEIVSRMLARGRDDDNEDTIRNRLAVFDKQTAPLIDYYNKQGKLSAVKGTGSVDEIFSRITAVLG